LSRDLDHGKIGAPASEERAAMTDRNETPGMAHAARLLDDMTQQLTPVPAFLDEQAITERVEYTPAAEENLDGHVL
jgi:hypothetical protein